MNLPNLPMEVQSLIFQHLSIKEVTPFLDSSKTRDAAKGKYYSKIFVRFEGIRTPEEKLENQNSIAKWHSEAIQISAEGFLSFLKTSSNSDIFTELIYETVAWEGVLFFLFLFQAHGERMSRGNLKLDVSFTIPSVEYLKKILSGGQIEKLHIDIPGITIMNELPDSVKYLKIGPGSFPQEFEFGPNIQELDLSSNKLSFTNQFYWEMSQLQNLKCLDLSSNGVANIDLIAPSFENLTRLEKLNLSYCNMTINSISCLSQLDQLRELDLSGNNINCIELDFRFLMKLEKLEIRSNNHRKVASSRFALSHHAIGSFTFYSPPKLIYLNLSGNNLRYSSYLKLSDTIQYLDLSNNGISLTSGWDNTPGFHFPFDLVNLSLVGNIFVILNITYLLKLKRLEISYQYPYGNTRKTKIQFPKSSAFSYSSPSDVDKNTLFIRFKPAKFPPEFYKFHNDSFSTRWLPQEFNTIEK